MKSQSHSYDQVVYFLQGGGALGTYQVGVCEGLLAYGYEPDWLIGTSIGAINAAIIAGNEEEHRIKKLKEFWNVISSRIPAFQIGHSENLERIQNFLTAQYVAIFGLVGFFKPRCINPWIMYTSTPDKLSYYDTRELHTTLEKVINFDLINQKRMRLTLGAVQIRTGKDVHFDNYYQKIGPEHIMASAALPPGFPAIKIDDEYYWDGGVSSNTPFSVILEEKIKKRLLCIIINLFSFPTQVPTSMMEILKAKKEFEYASRHQEILQYFLETHLFQNAINLLTKSTLASSSDAQVRAILKRIATIQHPLSLNILRFHYKDQPTNLVSSDFNFSPFVLKKHWECGVKDIQKALNKKLIWLHTDVGKSGAIWHEF